MTEHEKDFCVLESAIERARQNSVEDEEGHLASQAETAPCTEESSIDNSIWENTKSDGSEKDKKFRDFSEWTQKDIQEHFEETMDMEETEFIPSKQNLNKFPVLNLCPKGSTFVTPPEGTEILDIQSLVKKSISKARRPISEDE